MGTVQRLIELADDSPQGDAMRKASVLMAMLRAELAGEARQLRKWATESGHLACRMKDRADDIERRMEALNDVPIADQPIKHHLKALLKAAEWETHDGHFCRPPGWT